jgi:hypothetical protein
VARATALAATVALAVVLSLKWFAFEPPLATQADDAGGIVNLLNVYSLKGFHGSGWAGLGWLPVGCLGLAAAGAIAGLRRAAVAVGVISLAVLVVALATEDDGIVLRWPAYVGVALAALLVAAAAARLPSRP